MTEFNPAALSDPERVNQLLCRINDLAAKVADKRGEAVRIMEVCGGHTHAIFHSGFDQLLSQDIDLLHGPGCPVCVLPPEAIDKAVALAKRQNTMLVSFGDVLRVPGSSGSLLEAKARGADVRVAYSPMDAVALAEANPDKHVIFFAIGFDTTMPAVALTVQAAAKRDITNLRFLCFHIRLVPALVSLLEDSADHIDGLVGPGHVSIVIGSEVYTDLTTRFKKPLVIAGFEPVDVLSAILMLLKQLSEGRYEVENAYGRVVGQNGTPAALAAMASVFENSEVHWRGVGALNQSVSSLTPSYARFDASLLPDVVPVTQYSEPAWCNEVLKGRVKPCACPHFNRDCHPHSPKGALMVSSEGACAAYYRYRRDNDTHYPGNQHVRH